MFANCEEIRKMAERADAKELYSFDPELYDFNRRRYAERRLTWYEQTKRPFQEPNYPDDSAATMEYPYYCPHCGKELDTKTLLGYSSVSGFEGLRPNYVDRPSFCHHCDMLFPRTYYWFQVFDSYIALDIHMTKLMKDALHHLIPHIMVPSPESATAGKALNKLAMKVRFRTRYPVLFLQLNNEGCFEATQYMGLLSIDY